jgi:hypothetical protein
MSPDQSVAGHESAGDRKKMHDKINGADRAREGQILHVPGFISETGVELQPHMQSPRAALMRYRQAKPIIILRRPAASWDAIARPLSH